MKVGDYAIYHGPPQHGVLAAGDEVEIISYDISIDTYRIKIPASFTSYHFSAYAHDLSPLQPKKLFNGSNRYASHSFSLDEITNHGHTELVSQEETITKQRKEQGQCQTCGTKLSMSSFGLLPCTRCPQPLAKW